MDQKTKQLVDEAEARAAKATGGPWRTCGASEDRCQCGMIWAVPSDGVVLSGIARDEMTNSFFSHEQMCDNVMFASNARTDVPALCSAVREQDKRAQHAEEERDLLSKRIDELEAQLASKSIPTRKDVALALLRGIGPNPAEFMASGKDAFLGLADRIIQMFSDPASPKQTPAKQ